MPDRKESFAFHTILLSQAGFILLWVVLTDAWGYSSRLPVSHGSYIYAYFSRLVWAAPAVWLIVRYSGSLRFGRKELFSRPVWNRSLITVLAASVIYTAGCMFVVHGGFWLNPSVCLPLEVIRFALVGFAEETVFRGWGLNALSKAVTYRKAVAVSTAFFVLLHWPAYLIRMIRFGTLDWQALLLQSLAALVWGLVCGWLLKKGKTIMNPVIAHAAYDLLYILLVG